MKHPVLVEITDRIVERSATTRRAYLQHIEKMRGEGPLRGSLSCSNLAHGFAACDKEDKQTLKLNEAANIGIINSYNDMLSAHQPLAEYPEIVNSCRFFGHARAALKYQDKLFTSKVRGVDPSFFEMFTLPVLQGNAENPLGDRQSMVLTRKICTSPGIQQMIFREAAINLAIAIWK